MARRVRAPWSTQDLAQRPGLVQHPGVHGGDQGVAGDEVHLQRQDAEEQVAVGVRLAIATPETSPPRPRKSPWTCSATASYD